MFEGEGPIGDFRGEKLTNATHRSTTDPDARLMRKGKGREAKLVFMAHALMDNRRRLVSAPTSHESFTSMVGLVGAWYPANTKNDASGGLFQQPA